MINAKRSLAFQCPLVLVLFGMFFVVVVVVEPVVAVAGLFGSIPLHTNITLHFTEKDVCPQTCVNKTDVVQYAAFSLQVLLSFHLVLAHSLTKQQPNIMASYLTAR